MGDHFRFGSIFTKKNNQTEKKRSETEPAGSGPVLVRFFG